MCGLITIPSRLSILQPQPTASVMDADRIFPTISLIVSRSQITNRGNYSSNTLLFCFRSRPDSYLSFLLPLPNQLAHLQTNFLRHLDHDGISDLPSWDKFFSSIFYHTLPAFQNALIKHFEVIKRNVLPVGILTIPEICKQKDSMSIYDRIYHFGILCAYGSKDY